MVALSANPLLHPPLEGDLIVTGTMGEFRPSHFHRGIDFSTGGEIGKKVFAAHEGYISRIAFFRYGLGLGIWVSHSDGRNTKYGHLDNLAPHILEHPLLQGLREKIRLREEFDLHLLPEAIQVKRGEHIAFSGETGAGFAHLHFEYNDGDTALNPLFYGIDYKDNIPPTVSYVELIPGTPASRINGLYRSYRIDLKQTDLRLPLDSGGMEAVYTPLHNRIVRISGPVMVRLSSYDPTDGRSRLGLAGGALYQEDREIFRFSLKNLPQLNLRGHVLLYDVIHSHIGRGTNYVYNYTEKKFNSLPFMNSHDSGMLDPFQSPGNNMDIKVTASDAIGNRATVKLNLYKDSRNYSDVSLPVPNVRTDRDNVLKSPDGRMIIRIRSDSLYEDRYFKLTNHSEQLKLPRGLILRSAIYTLSPFYVDFLRSYEVTFRIRPGARQAPYYMPLRINRPRPMQYETAGNEIRFHGVGGARFVLLEDRAPPTITRLVKNNGSDRLRLFLMYHDIGSGIDYSSVRVRVDGIQCVTDHDLDRRAIEMLHPESIFQPGRHTIRVQLKDNAGNTAPEFRSEYLVMDAKTAKASSSP